MMEGLIMTQARSCMCAKCLLQPISSGAMSFPPGQPSLLGRPVRFIEKNDYLFCGS